MRRPRLLLVAVALAIAVAALAGCSSGSSTTNASTAASSPITVGVICTCSGAGGEGASVLPGEDAYKAWTDTVNASGGIDGHQVKLLAYDDAGNPATSLSAAETLVNDHVSAIVDLTNGTDETWASKVQAANIPVVGALTTGVPFATNPDFYPEGQTEESIYYSVVDVAKTAGATNIGALYCAESPLCAQLVPVIKSAGQKLRTPVVFSAEISATAPNYTAQCLAAQQQHVSSIYIGDASAINVRVGANCAQQGYNPIYVTSGASSGMNEVIPSGLGKNLWSSFPDLPFFAKSPQVTAFNTAMDKYFPGVRENANLFIEQNFQAWISGELLEAAVKAGGLTPSTAPTAAEVVKGLHSLKGETLGGLAPPLTFTAGKPNPIHCWFTAHVRNGVASIANGGKVTCSGP